jgi:tetratricopeptide (TPR) repeat protein
VTRRRKPPLGEPGKPAAGEGQVAGSAALASSDGSASSTETYDNAQDVAQAAAVAWPAFPQRWRPERLLGSGGQGDVWLAWDSKLEQYVAIKVLPGELRGRQVVRLRREVGEGRKLAHPNLVHVYELVEWAGHQAVVMEWVSGGSLRQKLAQGPLPVTTVVAVAEQVLEALAYLHEHGYVHRDVKPGNILLAEDGRYKLGDLGLLLPAGAETATLMAVGTMAYMSPEQLLGQQPGPPGDLYALAVTMYECLTGTLPPRPEEGLSLKALAVPNPRLVRPDCPRWLGQLVVRLGQADPQDRFAEGRQALEALRRRKPLGLRRVIRKGLAAAGVGAAVLALGLALRHGQKSAVSVRSEGQEAVGVGSNGQVVWRYELLAPVVQHMAFDVDGDGKQDWVFAAGWEGCRPRDGAPNSQVLAVSAAGEVLLDFRPDGFLRTENRMAPPLLFPKVRGLDLDGDGEEELVVHLRHRCLGTSYLVAFWPKSKQWKEILAHGGGWILGFDTVAGESPPALVFTAVNTTLGGWVTVGKVAIVPERRVNPIGFGGAAIPGFAPRELVKPLWYTPVESESFALGAKATFDEKGVTFFANGRDFQYGEGLRVDRWGNPNGSPLWGKDRGALRWSALVSVRDWFGAFMPGAFRGPAEVAEAERRWLAGSRELLVEPPYRAIHAIFAARHYAAAGGATQARALLARAFEDFPLPGVALAYGHLLAVQGDREKALSVLLSALQNQQARPVSFRISQLYSRVLLDEVELPDWQEKSTGYFARIGSAEPLEKARARIWYDEPEESDTSLESHDLLPEGAAFAALAAWRRGSLPPDAAEELARQAERNPDGVPEFLLAQGLARASERRFPEALGLLDRARVWILEEHSERWNFLALQNFQLVEACRAKVLLAAGKTREARALAESLQPLLVPGRLPANLVAEVLAATEHVSQPPRPAPPPSR